MAAIALCVLSNELPGGVLTAYSIKPWSSFGYKTGRCSLYHHKSSHDYNSQSTYSYPFAADQELQAAYVFIGYCLKACIKGIKETTAKTLSSHVLLHLHANLLGTRRTKQGSGSMRSRLRSGSQ